MLRLVKNSDENLFQPGTKEALEKIQELGITYLADLEIVTTGEKALKELGRKLYYGLVACVLRQDVAINREASLRNDIWKAVKRHIKIFLEYCEIKKRENEKVLWGKEFLEAITSIYLAVLKLIMTTNEDFITFSNDRELIKDLIKLGCIVEGKKHWLESLLSVCVINGSKIREWYECILASCYSRELKSANGNFSSSSFKDPLVIFLDEQTKTELTGLLNDYAVLPNPSQITEENKMSIEYSWKHENPSLGNFFNHSITSALQKVLKVFGETILEDFDLRLEYFTGHNNTNNSTLESSMKLLNWLIGVFPFVSVLLAKLSFNVEQYKFSQYLTIKEKSMSFLEALIRIGAVISPLGIHQLITKISETSTPIYNAQKEDHKLLLKVENHKGKNLELNHLVINYMLQVFKAQLSQLINERKQTPWEFIESLKWMCWHKAILKPIAKGPVEILDGLGTDIMNQCLFVTGKFLGNKTQDIYLDGFRGFEWEFFFIVLKDLIIRWAKSLGIEKKINTKAQFLYYLVILLKKKQKNNSSKSKAILNRELSNGEASNVFEKSLEEEFIHVNGEEKNEGIYNYIGFPAKDEEIIGTFSLNLLGF